MFALKQAITFCRPISVYIKSRKLKLCRSVSMNAGTWEGAIHTSKTYVSFDRKQLFLPHSGNFQVCNGLRERRPVAGEQ